MYNIAFYGFCQIIDLYKRTVLLILGAMKTQLFLLLSFLSFWASAQEGFKVIEKAEKKFERKHYRKTLLLLNQAEEMNYGFCGNAWMDANRSINLLRVRVHLAQKNYQLARNSLDSIAFEYRDDHFDSIIVRTYQLEIGVDSLSNMIDQSLKNTFFISEKLDWFALIPLTNGVDTLRFKIKSDNLRFLFDTMNYEQNQERLYKVWLDEFLTTDTYILIKQNE